MGAGGSAQEAGLGLPLRAGKEWGIDVRGSESEVSGEVEPHFLGLSTSGQHGRLPRSTFGGTYTRGSNGGGDRYGRVEIDDNGDRIRITGRAIIDGDEWRPYPFRIPRPLPFVDASVRFGDGTSAKVRAATG